MYQYAEVESALMRVNQIGEGSRSAFSARIGYFKRLGLLASTPGKGSRIVYKELDVLLIALCLEFSQLGIEPKRAAVLSRALWRRVSNYLLDDLSSEDQYLAGSPLMVTASLMEAGSQSDEVLTGLLPLDEEPANWVVTAKQASAMIEDRAVLINLSSLGRRVREALLEICRRN